MLLNLRYFLFLAVFSLLASCGGGYSGEERILSKEGFIENMRSGLYVLQTNEKFRNFGIPEDVPPSTFPGFIETKKHIVVDKANNRLSLCGMPAFPGISLQTYFDPSVFLFRCEATYSQRGDSVFMADYGKCRLAIDASDTFVRVSNTPRFDGGSLRLQFTDSTEYGIAVDEGVCGIASTDDTKFLANHMPGDPPTIEFDESRQTTVSVFAPYLNGSLIALRMVFSGVELVPGEYHIVPSVSVDGIAEASLSLDSEVFEFGAIAADAGILSATSGTVTVTSVTDRAYRGSYNVVLSNGEGLRGEFSLDF